MERILVVYYSKSGHTKRVAEKIGEIEKADLFEIKMKKARGSDVGLMLRRWVDPVLPLKNVSIKGDLILENYDQIYIGTPTWGFTYSQPVKEFIETHDFTGKKVSLFSTHDGGPGTSVSGMKRKLKNANVDKTIKIISSTCYNDNNLTQLLTRWLDK